VCVCAGVCSHAPVCLWWPQYFF